MTTPPLRIQYEVSITYSILPALSEYDNPDIPSSQYVRLVVEDVFLGKIDNFEGPCAGVYLLDTMKLDLQPSNPYYSTTVMSLAA